jgi:cellulose synthase/poly-beta-1,6-N-acetylglucosamine synthase-like glycosyltransferase
MTNGIDTATLKVPVLMITYNRFQYTTKALRALAECPGIEIYVIDNGSTDGTAEWLLKHNWTGDMHIHCNFENNGIAGAMNQFLKMTVGRPFCGKVDNDTIVEGDWARRMVEKCLRHNIDIMQARHPLIRETAAGQTFDEWTSKMPADPCDPTIRYHNFVGGSGIVFKRKMVLRIPETDWKLYGWREFQRQHPELKKAFCTDVTIKLLDEHGYGDYPEYYTETGRLKA